MHPNAEYTLAQHKRNARVFQQDSLPMLFYNCINALAITMSKDYSEADKAGIARLLLKILVSILEFSNQDSQQENSDISLPSPNSLHWAALQSINTSKEIYDLFKLMLDSNDTEAAQYCLKFQRLYVSINSKFYSSPEIRISILLQIVEGIRNILRNRIGFDNEEVLYEYVRLVAILSCANCLSVI